MISRLSVVVVLVLLGWLGVAADAGAAVTCRVDGSTAMDFGKPAAPIGSIATTSTVQVSCVGTQAADVGDSALVCVGATVPNSPRRMVRTGTQYLYYDIFSDPGHTQQVDFANNASTAVTIGPVGTRVGGVVTLHGELVSPQTSPVAGSYTETVTAVWGFSTATGANCVTVPQATPNFTFTTRATLYGSCLISAADLNFGNYTNLNSVRTGATSVVATCTSGTQYRISLNGGTGGTIANRRMRLNGVGPKSVGYNLYTDPGYSQLWGDGATGARVTGVGAGSGIGTPQSIAVFGRIPIDPAATAGSYTDTVTATIEY